MDGGHKILHGLNGREYRLPEIPNFSVDGFCPGIVYEFYGCYFHGHACQPYRDVITKNGDTLAERYECTMARAGYKVEVQCECEFEGEVLSRQPELKTHPVVGHSRLNTRDALYRGRTEAMRLHYMIREGEETVQYVDVNSLYPYVCKYFKFPVGHPVIHVGDMSRQRGHVAKGGLIKCCILHPMKLYHPVLRFR